MIVVYEGHTDFNSLLDTKVESGLSITDGASALHSQKQNNSLRSKLKKGK